ncbi:leukotriene B4 receptor 1-like [Megalops cyprinoides]|uniref:leukotriene B4 receptor 1-like n=1 Tax=Megalops cyprinoides TaxID=118141 RepID=UPI0018654DF0|nr:leukotriene B4 receptor 1-like [Megalops cyprinoides]
MNASSSLPNEGMEQEDFAGRTVVACVILGLSFLVGAPGNLLVIWTILQHVKHRSHTVVLILHLAAADLLVLITLPLWIYSFAYSWVFGEVACKAMVYIINSCMYSSVFLITVMSVERFVAVRYPFASISWKKRRLMNKVLLVLWTVAFLFSVPVIPTQVLDKEDGKEQCLVRMYSSVSQEVVCLLLEILVGFVVPFSILMVCYCCLWRRITQMTFKSKQKSSVLIASVVIAFTVCWVPHQVENVLSLVTISMEESYPQIAKDLDAIRNNMTFIAGAFVFIGSTINPLLYAFAARNFQSSLQDIGIKKLFHQISNSGTGDGTKELSFVSRKQSSQNKSLKCSTESNVPIVVLNISENVSS